LEGTEGYSTPENPIRRFMMSPSIYNIIKNGLMDPDIEEMPTHKEKGLDFRIKKTDKAGWANYDSSTYSRKESALTQEELDAIEEHGLYNLKDFLPKQPTEEVQKIIMEMFEASVDGEAYDPEKWGNYYKPYGMDIKQDDDKKSDDKETKTTDTNTEEKVEEASAVVKDEPAKEEGKGDQKAQDILKMIRDRQK